MAHALKGVCIQIGIGDMFLVMSCFTIFMPISALQLSCGSATDESRWLIHQPFRNPLVHGMNSGAPSDVSSSLLS